MLTKRLPPGRRITRSAGLRRRVRWVIAVTVVALGALGTRLWHRPSSHGDGNVEAARSRVMDWRLLPPARGKILDRNGTPIADNRRAFNIYVVPRLFTSSVRTALIQLLDLSAEEVQRMDGRAAHGGSHRAGRAILVLEDQGRERADRVAGARRELGGAVEAHGDSWRDYPNGELAGHLIGYLGPPTSLELAELARQGYDASELIGRYGLEKALERSLHGKKGIERFIIDAKGGRMAEGEVEALLGGARLEAPVAGLDVVLTLDLELQKMAEKAVRKHAAAAVVVVEVETGRILALVSTPSFDPNRVTGGLAPAEQQRLASDPRRPYLDRTLEQHYSPASTFKLVTAVAGLESSVVSPHEKLTCTGRRAAGKRVMYCMHVHGALDFLAALQRSCNIYFWTIGERVGLDRMAEVARDFGFGTPTGLGINGDLSGRVPDTAMYDRQPGHSLEMTLNVATGEGDVKATVIQVAMAYAALANGGRLYAPQVVRRVQTSSGQVVEEREPILRHRVSASPATLAVIRKGMWRVVNARGGTAFGARRGAVKMAGKSGTAPVRSGRPPEEDEKTATLDWDPSVAHGWFAGWAPSVRPQIAFAVFIEHGGGGGKVAAPVARTIVNGYFSRVLPHQRRGGRRVRP